MEERSITKLEIRELYAHAAKLGMNLHGDDDDLHTLVFSVTGKDSIRALSKVDFFSVLHELKCRLSGSRPAPAVNQTRHRKAQPDDFPPGKVTEAQYKCIFGMAYEIVQKEHLDMTAGEVIQRYVAALLETDICITVGNPFRMISQEDGSRIIEGLKRRLRYADANYRRREKRKSSR